LKLPVIGSGTVQKYCF